VTVAPLHCPIRFLLFLMCGVGVCDGGHSLDVMKKVRWPAQAKLGRGTPRSRDYAGSGPPAHPPPPSKLGWMRSPVHPPGRFRINLGESSAAINFVRANGCMWIQPTRNSFMLRENSSLSQTELDEHLEQFSWLGNQGGEPYCLADIRLNVVEGCQFHRFSLH